MVPVVVYRTAHFAEGQWAFAESYQDFLKEQRLERLANLVAIREFVSADLVVRITGLRLDIGDSEPWNRDDQPWVRFMMGHFSYHADEVPRLRMELQLIGFFMEYFVRASEL